MFSFRNCAFLLIDMQRGFVEPDGEQSGEAGDGR